MRVWAISLLIFGILGLGILPQASQGQVAETPEKIFKPYGVPPFPGLAYLCRQRVYPNSGAVASRGKHITWDAFTSASPPSALIDYYKKELGVQGFTLEGAGGTWRFPPSSPRPERVLSIHPSDQAPLVSSCEAKNPHPSGSVLILSSF